MLILIGNLSWVDFMKIIKPETGKENSCAIEATRKSTCHIKEGTKTHFGPISTRIPTWLPRPNKIPHLLFYIISINKTVKYKTQEGVFPSFVRICQTDQWFCKTSFQEKAKNFSVHNKIKLENFLHWSEQSDALPCTSAINRVKKPFFVKLTRNDTHWKQTNLN